MMGVFDEFRGNPPATPGDVEAFENGSGIRLPNEYTAFLKTRNGGEGFIGNESYLILWKVGDLQSLNSAYEVKAYVPDLLIFGSDGGGEAYAIDYSDPALAIVAVPFVGMERGLVRKISSNFNEFLNALAVKS
jgi:SMI1 / KNR4 family (SUKH-1)